MTTPIVAVVGRPNVGKSTLFNRLAGKSLAIVDDAPGITRDRHYAPAHLAGREVTLVDTGGFDPASGDPMQQGIARHVEAAIAEADVIVCVLDGTLPPTTPDREAVALLRGSNKPVVYVANKVDNDGRALQATELFSLGVPELVNVSALHGRGTAELAVKVVQGLPPYAEDEPQTDDLPRIALIGRPNAGKSSLFNRLSGEERALVDDRPGTTRDALDARVTYDGKELLVVDTAGIRRKSRVEEKVELLSVMQALKAVERARIAVLMCDATEGVAEQDARLLGLCMDRNRGLIIGLNKIDLLSREDRKKAREKAEDALRFAPFAPIMEISAKTGLGVSELVSKAIRISREWNRRVSTAELNRFFRNVIERQPPPTDGGRAPRIFYVTQAESAPPLFVAMCSGAANIKTSYQRFVVNQLRKTFNFEGVPIQVHYKEKSKKILPPKPARPRKGDRRRPTNREE
ncbi:MAG TPA: ribosome biogenesis GTPase Der [Polyangiaceae bacterium]|nr:ribosome biogenesis GTPase Der [Polyangiaceae bacterium]